MALQYCSAFTENVKYNTQTAVRLRSDCGPFSGDEIRRLVYNTRVSTQPYYPDERDWQIINLLRSGTISNSAIAKDLDVSEGMVRQRIKRLKDAGVLSLRGLINPDIMDNSQVVLLGANVAETRRLDETAQQISRLQNVLSVSLVSGRFDLFIELLLDSHQGLVDFLISELSQVDGIVRTESFVTLKAYSKFV